METVNHIKRMRLSLDACINTINTMRPSREVSLSKTSLQRSFSWLGEALKAIGNPNPYPESMNAKSDKIEPRADHVENVFIPGWGDLPDDPIPKVKHMRNVLEMYIKEFSMLNADPLNVDAHTAINQSLISLKDAKIWMGWELGTYKDSQRLKEQTT